MRPKRRGGFGLAAAGVTAALLVTSCGGGAGSDSPAATSADVAAGQALFQSTCATCHGADGGGVPNLGKDMRGNQWIAEQSDVELIEFLKRGRKGSDPRNITGIDMPPRGGNTTLTDEDLAKIVRFLRTL